MIVKYIVTACNKHSNTETFAYNNSKYYVNKEKSCIATGTFQQKLCQAPNYIRSQSLLNTGATDSCVHEAT